ncbi:MAG: cation:proton antiporter [Bacteroidales bacterium]|nr:cation:proton antiporter [Bacteroidales bacterium]
MEHLNINLLIQDLALILGLAAIASLVFKLLKQPAVLGYIVAGFLASPHFSFLPNVASHDNVEFWAQIGIIVLLFSLGLEFSFKKLLKVGGSAVLTALIIVLGMMGSGFMVGKMLGMNAINSIFLGGMISMSSTTIILKALTDLNMRQRRFVPGVFAVLVVEDLFAVVLMVVLSSVAVHQSVSGEEMIETIFLLVLFLVMWFTVGIFLIPSIFRRLRRYITDELMLVLAMALCFFMAIAALKSGYSLALGAFVMGSILAGTSEAERIESIITPVKNLFGAVFFISVGMLVDPVVMAENATTITVLSLVVIVGMIFFGTFGMLAMGQPLRIAMQSGFCLTQIGEFSFIIATTGMSLGVLDGKLYPIIVAVSVITTFFTPFFIKGATPCYEWVAKKLPKSWNVLLDGYSSKQATSEHSENRKLWRKVVRRNLVRTIFYSAGIIIVIVLHDMFIHHHIGNLVPGDEWDNLMSAAVVILLMLPLIYGLSRPNIKSEEKSQIVQQTGRISLVPLVVMCIFNFLLSNVFFFSAIYGLFTSQIALLIAAGVTLAITVLFSPLIHKQVMRVEKHFINNANQRENRRTGKERVLVSDLHLAHMRVGYGCPFVGEKLKNARLRQKYGIHLASIQRNSVEHLVPDGEMRIFPGDILGVIGSDEQILEVLPIVESTATAAQPPVDASNVKFTHFTLCATAPIVGRSLKEARLSQDFSALLVSVERDGEHLAPDVDLVFQPGDILWIVGDTKRLQPLHE